MDFDILCRLFTSIVNALPFLLLVMLILLRTMPSGSWLPVSHHAFTPVVGEWVCKKLGKSLVKPILVTFIYLTMTQGPRESPSLYYFDRNSSVRVDTIFDVSSRNEKSPHHSVQQNRCGDFPSYILHHPSYILHHPSAFVHVTDPSLCFHNKELMIHP